MNISWYDVSQKITWSALGGIGNSKVARLTILMPIVGYLILFNNKLQEYLQISLAKIGMEVSSPEFLKSLQQQNMYFLYFGLLIFGLGMTLYAIFAPQQVKKYSSAEDYMLAMEDVRTDNIALRAFNDTVFTYFINDDKDKSPAFPNDLNYDLHQLTETAFEKIDDSDKGKDFYNESGDLLTGKVIYYWSVGGNSVTKKLKLLISEKLKDHPKDIFNLQYRALDHERPLMRLFICSFFVTGIILTFIPTLVTSIVILNNWIFK